METWEGEEAGQLREFIKKGDLSYGYQICKKQINSGNYFGVRGRYYDKYPSRPVNLVKRLIRQGGTLQVPQSMEFELSNICNLECTMCNGLFSSLIRKNQENLPE